MGHGLWFAFCKVIEKPLFACLQCPSGGLVRVDQTLKVKAIRVCTWPRRLRRLSVGVTAHRGSIQRSSPVGDLIEVQFRAEDRRDMPGRAPQSVGSLLPMPWWRTLSVVIPTPPVEELVVRWSISGREPDGEWQSRRGTSLPVRFLPHEVRLLPLIRSPEDWARMLTGGPVS